MNFATTTRVINNDADDELVGAVDEFIKHINDADMRECTVGTFIVSDTFGDSVCHDGFVARLDSSAAVCPDIISAGNFMGCIGVLRVPIAPIVARCEAIKPTKPADAIYDILAHTCPIATPESQHTPPAGCVIANLRHGERLQFTDCIATEPADVRPWTACIDENGFAGLYQHTTKPDEGLLVVCCRTTAAAQELRDTIYGAKQHIRYCDIVQSPVYTCVLELARRNVRRLLYDSAVALGVPPELAARDLRAVPTRDTLNFTSPIELCKSAGPAVPPVCCIIDALQASLDAQPMMAIPDMYNMLDVFVPHGSATDYYNATFPNTPALGMGDFISAANGHTIVHSITAYARAGVRTVEDIEFFDGRFTTRAASLPPNADMGIEYAAVCIIGGVSLQDQV
jgi:hypothetical protein